MNNNISIKKILEDFIEIVVKPDLFNNSFTEDKIIYNEFSLQHELAKFLERKLPENYLVQFEKPIGGGKARKKECDIVIKKKGETHHKIAIELKFPTKNSPIKKFFKFLEDIKFMEEIGQQEEFDETYCFVVASHIYHDANAKYNFRSLNDNNGIKRKYYEMFRVHDGKKIYIKNFNGEVGNIYPEKVREKDKNKKQYQPIKLKDKYETEWIKISKEYKYYILKVK